jgi:hypothetical protein
VVASSTANAIQSHTVCRWSEASRVAVGVSQRSDHGVYKTVPAAVTCTGAIVMQLQTAHGARSMQARSVQACPIGQLTRGAGNRLWLLVRNLCSSKERCTKQENLTTRFHRCFNLALSVTRRQNVACSLPRLCQKDRGHPGYMIACGHNVTAIAKLALSLTCTALE